MKQHYDNQSFREKFEAHLDSPSSLLSKLKSWIFGDENPDMYTQVSFFIGLIIAVTFLIWSILGYVAISGRDWIEAEKGLNVENLIQQRGIQLGFEPDDFLNKLEIFYSFSSVVWSATMIGLILQWRKRPVFIYVIGIASSLYLVVMWFMLGFSYWFYDTTTYDKITFFLLIGHSLLYTYFLKQELNGEKTNFFGIDED